MQKTLAIQKFYGPTDGQMDVPTNTARCRVACPRLKKRDRGRRNEPVECTGFHVTLNLDSCSEWYTTKQNAMSTQLLVTQIISGSLQFFDACYVTLHPALSVALSVRPSVTLYFFLRFLAPLLLPKWSDDLNYSPCPPARDWGSRVSGLVLLYKTF